jgi:muscarinic acetylcholine receptor
VLLLLSIKLLFLLWAVTACIAATAAATTGLLSSASPRIALKSVRVNKTTVYDLSDSGQQTSSSDVPDESGGFNILYSEDISIESSLSSSANAHKHPESTEESANSFYNSAPNGNNNNNNGRFNRTFDLNNIFSQEQDFVVESGSSGLTEESVESKRLSFSNEAGIYPNVGGALNYDESTAVDTASSTTALPESSPTQIYSLPAKIILSTLAASASLITVCGNFLVMTAFFLDRQIRNPTNYFLLSLAISDFLIGLFSIPILTIYLMIGVWPFGQIICNLWLSLDYTVCLTSIYTVLFITIDRFCSVKMPAKYRKWRTPNKIIVMVLLTWIIPFSLFFPSIFGWSYGSGVAFDPRNCDVAWASNKAFSVTLVFSYFWSTLVVIVVLYVFIYQVARNLERKSRDKQRKLSSLVGSGANASNALVGVVAIAVNNSKQINKGKVTKTTSVVSANRMSECDDEDEELSGVNAPTPAAANGSVKSRIGAKVGFAKSFLSGGKKNNVNKKDSGKSKRWMPTDRSSSQMMPTSMHESHSSDLARGNNNNNNNNNSSNSTTTGGYAKQSNSGGKQELVIVGNRKMMISDDMSSSYESHSDFDTAANNSAGVGSSVKRPLLSVKSNTLSVTAPPSSSSLLLKRVDEPQPVVAVATLKQQRPESLAIVAHELSPTGVTVSASNPNPSAKTQSSNVSLHLI